VIIALGAVILLGMGAVAAATIYSGRSSTSMDFGGLGSAHEHAAFIVKLDGNQINFAQQKYQVKSPYIHVENGVGTTLHKHASTVPFGEFLKSIGMNVANGCFITDDGKQYCNSGDKKLRFFLNGSEESTSSIMNYILIDDDRFLIIYGNESPLEIQNELARLNAMTIFRN